MIHINVVCGGGVPPLLWRVLSRSFEVLCVTQREIIPPDIAPEILLVCSGVPLECEGDTIYVIGPGACPREEEGFTVGPRAVAVVSAQNVQGLEFASRHHLKTLTCGLSERDTLTLSSSREDSAVISLQREIATFGGGVMEPADIPVRLRAPVERYELLTVAAVLLLCGDADHLTEPIG